MADNLMLDLITYLKTAGVVDGDGQDAFRDLLPETPDDVVAFFETAGLPGSVGADAAVRGMQVRVRSLDAEAARQLAWDVYNQLYHPMEPIIQLTTTRWAIIMAQQTPFKMRVDQNGRSEYVFNLLITTYVD